MKKTIITILLILMAVAGFSIAAKFHMLNGDKFECELLTEEYTFITPYTEITLNAMNIESIEFPSPGNRITKLYTTYTNERLTGILLNPAFTIKTVGNEIKILKDKVKRIDFENTKEKALKYTAEIFLRSGDFLYGNIKIDSMQLETSYGDLDIEIKDIQNINFEGLGNVISTVNLRKKDKMKGVVVNDYIPFDLLNDGMVEIVPDRIAKIAFKHRVFDEKNETVSDFKSEAFGSEVNVIKIDDYNKYAYVGFKDGHIRTFDLQNGKLFQAFKAHDGAVRDISIDKNAKYLITSGTDDLIKIWDLNSQENLRVLRGHQDWVLSIDYNDEHSLIASGGRDGTIRLWDFVNGSLLNTIDSPKSSVMGVKFSENGDFLLSASIDQKVLWWDLREFNKNDSNPKIKAFASYQRRGKSARSCNISVNGAYVMAGFTDGEFLAWKKFGENKILAKRGIEKIANTKVYTIIPFEQKEKQYVLAGNEEAAIHIFHISGNGLELVRKMEITPDLTSIYVSEDGKFIVRGFKDGSVSLKEFTL